VIIHPKESMSEPIKVGTILIRAGTLLPESLQVQLQPFSSRWEIIKNSDGKSLDRSISAAGWHLFFLAASINTVAWGHGGTRSVRTAIRRVLAKVKLSRFNCLEVTEISARRFLGLPYVHLSAHSRHLQKDLLLQGLAERSRTQVAAAWAIG
jgi:hypothetical protein